MLQRPIRTLIENRRGLAAPPQTTVFHATRMMQELGEGAVMVVDAGRLAGIFTERDVLYRVVAEGRDPKITLLSQVMSTNPQTIHPDNPIGNALRMMLKGGFRNVPVVEYDQPLGIVSIRDALSDEFCDFASERAGFPISTELFGLSGFRTSSGH